MALDAKKCAEIVFRHDAAVSSSGAPPREAVQQLSAALELLRECRKIAYNLQNEHPALSDLLEKLTEAGIE